MKIQESPQFDPPLEETGKKFSKHWMDWFTRLAKGLQDEFDMQVQSNQVFSTTAGPGPLTLTVNLTVRTAATLLIHANIVQTWVTAQPTWLLEILVDGGVVWTSGTQTIWQPVVAAAVEWDLAAGAHSASVRWTAGSANASVTQSGIFATPKLK